MATYDQGLGIPMGTHCLKKVNNLLRMFVTELQFNWVRISVAKAMVEINTSVNVRQKIKANKCQA